MEDVPEDRESHGRTLQLAAVAESSLKVAVLADGGIAVHGRGVLAVAPARTGQLVTKPEWLRGWPSGWAVAMGGRWPDDAFVTARWAMTRTGIEYAVWRWRDDAWVKSPIAGAATQVNYYSDYGVGADGAALGLRGFAEFGFGSDEGTVRRLQAADPSLRTTIDRLEASVPPPWPPLPPGDAAGQLLTFADGTMVVLRGGASLLRWSPGGREWGEYPPLPEPARLDDGGLGQAVVVGRDPERLYVHRCAPGDRAQLVRMMAGAWRPVELPRGGCVRSLAEAPDGTLWLVNDRGLHRCPPRAERWEEVPLPPIDAPGKPVAALDGSPLPPPGPEPVTPEQVVALDRGEVWVVATIGREESVPPRQAVLTTRTVIAPMILRPVVEGTGD